MGIKAIKSVENNLRPDAKFDLQNMIKIRKETITHYYRFIKKVGAGTYGEVFMAEHEATGHIRAIKKINTFKFSKSKTMIMNEISLLKSLVETALYRIIQASSKYMKYLRRGNSSTLSQSTARD